VRLGPAAIRFAAVHLPDIQQPPEVGPSSVRFVQTVGGRMGIPTPRPVKRKPFAQFWPSIAWSTLELTINADGTSSRGLTGASPFPRHWVYDEAGALTEKSGLIDFKTWADHCFGEGTPWGSYESPALVTSVESALERQLGTTIMRGGAKPKIRTLDAGAALTRRARLPRRSTSSWTGFSPSRSTAARSPRSGLTRSWASERRSRGASGRRRCARPLAPAWPRSVRTS